MAVDNGAAVTKQAVAAAVTVQEPEATQPNTILGESAGASLAATAERDTLVGLGAGEGLTTGRFNTLVGAGAGRTTGTADTANTYIGDGAGTDASGSHNTYVGATTASATAGSGNIFIGNEAGGAAANAENRLIVANNPNTALIEGTLSGTQTLGFFGVAPAARPAVTGATVTAKQLAEALATLGLVKVN